MLLASHLTCEYGPQYLVKFLSPTWRPIYIIRERYTPSDTFTMTVISEYGSRPASYANAALEDRFEVIKEIGDGSFGSVSLARVRANGASVARRGTMVSAPSSVICEHY